MSFLDLLKIEFMKVKRSKIVPLIFIAPLLVVVSGVASLSNYFTPEYTNAWPAMFIQSALVYAYYLLPFSMIVVCVMIAGRETGNNGILKMLALPVSRCTLSIAKFCVLTFYLFMEMVVFLVVFVIAGLIATQTMGVTGTLPILYAVVFLEKLGVVKRVFRTISMNGIVVNNVLYLELIVDRLKELTYPEETGADTVSFEKRREKSKAEKISSHTAIEEEIHFVEERAVPFQRERVSPFKEGAYPDRETEPWIPKEGPQTDSGHTNTEITTKTTAESTQKNTTEIVNGYRDNPILSYQAAEEQFKDQIDYDAIWIDRPFDRKLLNEIVGLAVDVLTSNAKTIRVNQEERPLGIVQGMYKKLDKITVEYVIDSIKQCTRKANNIRAVLLTALYNATLTANSYISNLFAYQEAIPQT